MSHGSPEALYVQGRALLARGEPIAALARLRDAAHAGHAQASHCVSMLLASEANAREAWEFVLSYTGRAAKAGHALAQRTLAFMANDREAQAAIARGEALGEQTWYRLHDAIDLDDWLKPRQKIVLRETPYIAVLENFIPPAMCDWICEQARPRLQRAMVYDQGGQLQTHAVRTNSDMRFTFPETDLVLMLTANAISKATGCRFRDHEEAAVLHYVPGQEFKAHFDFLLPPHPGVTVQNQRLFTLLIYLNDDYEGGKTAFPHLGFGIKGRKGDALMFRNLDANGQPDQKTLHAGSPTTQGEKWLFSQWIRAPQD